MLEWSNVLKQSRSLDLQRAHVPVIVKVLPSEDFYTFCHALAIIL